MATDPVIALCALAATRGIPLSPDLLRGMLAELGMTLVQSVNLAVQEHLKEHARLSAQLSENAAALISGRQ